jgi:hypothetical protein
MKNTIVLMTVIALCPALRATTAFSSFSSGSFNTGSSFNADGGAIAQKFTALTTGDLASLTVALGVSPDVPNQNDNIADIFLYTDSAGAPGTVLESFSINLGTFHDPTVDPQDLVFTVDSTSNPLITSGQTYWVEVAAENPIPNPVIWYAGLIPPDAGIDIFVQGAWVPESPNPTDAQSLDVEVQSGVPEPATWTLLGAGVGALALRQRALHLRNR